MEIDIIIDDLPDDIRNIAELIGLDACLKLVKTYSGEQIYFPKYDSITRKQRNRDIYDQFLSGKGYEELAHKYNLTVSSTREIINEERRIRQKEPVQLPSHIWHYNPYTS